MAPGKQARIPRGSRHTKHQIPIPGITLGFRHPSVQPEAGTHLYETPTAKIVALSKKKLNMLRVLLVQKCFWQIKGQEKQPPGTCGEAPPEPSHPPKLPSIRNIIRQADKDLQFSHCSHFYQQLILHLFLFFNFLLLVYFTDSRCRELLTPHTHSLYILKSNFKSLFLSKQSETQKNPASQLLQAGCDTTSAHSHL